MRFSGVLWGLYHNDNHGWAMTTDQDHHIFPFWLNSSQAQKHANKHWPNYTPKSISPSDFQESLLPTLMRLNVTPTLYRDSEHTFKLSSHLMKYFFFNNQKHFIA